MFNFLSIFIVGLVCLLSSGATNHAEGAEKLDGKYLFNNHCSACHGVGGVGTGMLRAIKGSDFLKKATDKDIETIIVEGTSAGMIPMPAMKDKLKKEEIEAIVEYIKSLK